MSSKYLELAVTPVSGICPHSLPYLSQGMAPDFNSLSWQRTAERVREGAMGKAIPNPLYTGSALPASHRLGRSVGRIRASMSWCAMPSQVQEYTIPPTPVLLSLWVGACVGHHSLRHRHAKPNRVAAGAEVVNVPHRLETHKQGAAE